MTSKMKLGLIVMAFVVLAMASIAYDDPMTPDATPVATATPAPILGITPGDGQVGDAIMKGYNEIRETASEVKDAVDSTGDGLEVETHGTIVLDTLWDWAIDIAKGDD